MRPIQTASSNIVYVGPAGVGDLHCQRIARHHVRSVWELTPEERTAIAAGANIVLSIYQEPIPPVALEVAIEDGVGEDDPAVRERLREVIGAGRYG